MKYKQKNIKKIIIFIEITNHCENLSLNKTFIKNEKSSWKMSVNKFEKQK